jgi:Zinc dependent phospholipase C
MDFSAPRTYLFNCRFTRFASVEMAMTSAASNASAKKRKTTHRAAQVLFALLLICVVPNMSLGYSVLTHEAIIDSMWVHDITPVLLKRFPGATADELREAHAYAYGGAIIQDMGYYPFGSKFYSDLTHYVRSGDFVEALLRDAQDIKEYAFAVGALSHYWADNGGHPIATNPSVPILYPKLKSQFGSRVTYEQNPAAHIQTEFGFDVLQIAQGHYASQDYHDFIGFSVAKPLLQRAFKETYGIELASLFSNLDLALGTYRHTVSTLIPTMTRVAWETAKRELAKRGVAQASTVTADSVKAQAPKAGAAMTRDKFLYNLSRSAYSKEWGDQYSKPSFLDRVLAFLFRIMPKIGPFRSLNAMPSTPATELLFMRGFDSTTVAYRKSLVQLGANNLQLEDRDLDTGKPTRSGEYARANGTFEHLLHSIAGNKFQDVTPELRANLLAFFRDTTMRTGTKKDSVAWSQTLRDLNGLRAADSTAHPPGGVVRE